MLIEIYRQFKRARKGLGFTGRFMPYHWGALPNPLSAMWMAYAQMFDEFSRELANAINAFTLDIQSLKAWDIVTAPLSDEQQMKVAREFIDTLGTHALGTPYMLRSRFIFATAHLCHQANMAKIPSWRDDLPLDGEIYMAAADRHGAHWKAYNPLKRRLEAIAGKTFRDATNDFRNAYNHRFSPRFLQGMTQLVIRNVDTKSGAVSYGFGGAPALKLANVVTTLTAERDRCYAAFDAFQALVREQEAAIVAF